MKLTILPNGILQIDDARITHKNFAGVGGPYNREGDKNFSLIIEDQETADLLIQNGWNIKIRPPREEDEEPFMYLKVKVAYNDFGPNVYLQSGSNRRTLDKESVACLDNARLTHIDLDIRPYDWEMNGKTGRTAYLQAMCATQEVDRFAVNEIGY